MAKTTKKEEKKVVTRAEKKDAAKNVIKELLAVKPHKHNELIEETAKIYTERFGGEDTENINDVKGRVGSVIDIMKKDSEIAYEGGMYALKSRLVEIPTENKEEEKPAKKPRATAKKTVKKAAEKEVEVNDEKPAQKTAKTAAKKEKTEEKPTEKVDTPKKTEKSAKKVKKPKLSKEKETETEKTPLPPAPLQPIAPVAPVTPEVAPEPIPEKEETQKPEKKPVKKTTRSRVKKVETPKTEKAEEKTDVAVKETPKAEEKTEEKPVEIVKKEVEEAKNLPIIKEKAEVAKKTEVMDMSFLFGAKPVQKADKPTEKVAEKPFEKRIVEEEKPVQKAEEKPVVKTEIKPAPKAVEKTPEKQEKTPALKVVKTDERRVKKVVQTLRQAEKKPQTADERLQEAFLRKLRSLGGDYFEYYSVYLLERYSMKNGRRLEGMKISGGDKDGGIDGEIELTDKFGFKETIYIQSKNWNPDKGDERLWVVGETLLQQFIGACACRQAQDKKQHCRGIFVTTSRFTPDAKRILEAMSDKIVGYDGADLYEAAKECQFGVVYENGNWKLDEKLLSGTKAFFNML
jgi:restriction endonuclease Mrr